VYGSPKF